MDNVIIDDRRIHVDFSQSVAKVKWKNKGKDQDSTYKSSFNSLFILTGLKCGKGNKKKRVQSGSPFCNVDKLKVLTFF